ncbi:MAG TPA: ATP-binding protein, partial [Myxococcota bacterium]
TDGGATGKLAQRALLGVTSVPVAIGFVILRGESAGLWDAHYGTVLFATSNLVVLAALTWWVAAKLLRAEVAQREREQWLATTLASIGDAVIATDNDARVVRMNAVASALTGWSASDAIGKPLDDVFHIISEDKRAKVESPAARVLQEGVTVGLANHTLLVAKDGSERPIADSGAPIRDANGRVHGVVLVFRDQTEAHRAELVLRASDQRFRRISESGIVGVVVSDGDKVVEANDTFLRAVGRPRADVDAGTLLLREVVAGQARADEALEMELVRADGGKTPVLATSAVFDEQKSLSLFVDLSAQKRAQAAHSESQSTVRSLEAQLQQAQKMEAIGSLAGGVAHDFNNLLTVVLSYSEIVLSTLAHDDPSYRDVEEIRKAGHRAASLTRQLLAFSRRQILQPHVVELNSVVDGMMKMLERLLPESIDLSFATRAHNSAVNVDAGQFEQVLLNLVVNARDAMPSGGTIAVATEHVEVDQRGIADRLELEPGAYVVLRVSDNGAGMDAATQSRIFEPFFTTKDKSKGTGLGLSVVFGIVRQSGGAIWVYSEVGKGTTFKVYLPHSRVSPRDDAEQRAAPAGGHETLLLVEDEETVRRLASRILRRAGYEVLEAGDGADALALCEKHGGIIHLL